MFCYLVSVDWTRRWWCITMASTTRYTHLQQSEHGQTDTLTLASMTTIEVLMDTKDALLTILITSFTLIIHQLTLPSCKTMPSYLTMCMCHLRSCLEVPILIISTTTVQHLPLLHHMNRKLDITNIEVLQYYKDMFYRIPVITYLHYHSAIYQFSCKNSIKSHWKVQMVNSAPEFTRKCD